MDLTEAEDIKKRWQEYTGELYKKELHDPDNHDGVITHLELDILECEVQWALRSITTNKVEVRNRFKGLDLIDRVPDELWTDVHDIVQDAKRQNDSPRRPYK